VRGQGPFSAVPAGYSFAVFTQLTAAAEAAHAAALDSPPPAGSNEVPAALLTFINDVGVW
jgi:hypothetical protein